MVCSSFRVRPWCHTVSYAAVHEVHQYHAYLVALFEGFLDVIGKVDNLMDSTPTTAEASLLVRQLACWVWVWR